MILKLLHNLGWAGRSATKWITDQGLKIYLPRMAPNQVAKLAKQAARATSDKLAMAAADKRPGGWAAAVGWQSFKEVLKPHSKQLSERGKAGLRALASNTVWSAFQSGAGFDPLVPAL